MLGKSALMANSYYLGEKINQNLRKFKDRTYIIYLRCIVYKLNPSGAVLFHKALIMLLYDWLYCLDNSIHNKSPVTQGHNGTSLLRHSWIFVVIPFPVLTVPTFSKSQCFLHKLYGYHAVPRGDPCRMSSLMLLYKNHYNIYIFPNREPR